MDPRLGRFVRFQVEIAEELHLNRQGFLRPALFQSWRILEEPFLVRDPQMMEVEPH